MDVLDNIQTNIDKLYEALAANDNAINELRSNLNSLINTSETELTYSNPSPVVDDTPYWMDYIFPPNSNLLRYKCSNCGYIATYKLLSCPRCKECIEN